MPDRQASTSKYGRVAQATAPESTTNRCAVLLPLPFDEPYDYFAPPSLTLSPGDIVRVPLGSREVRGVVWEQPPNRVAGSSVAAEKLKPVQARYPVPPMAESMRRFVEWVANYTLAPLGAVLRMALSVPTALEPPKPATIFSLAPDAEEPGLRMTRARQRVLAELRDGPARSSADLARAAGVSASVIKGLADAGQLCCDRIEQPSLLQTPLADHLRHTLTEVQEAAAEDLRRKVRGAGFGVTLLDGVTGSGKTEVYFEAIAEALRQERQSLVLLPEIALSAQWLERFERRFGTRPGLWHSNLTQAQRRDTWRAVAEGRLRVLVGARSALFLPFHELGVIIVDEEQDTGFKQEDGVIYHGRDMAVVRARTEGFPIVLVSATPALETVGNVRTGRYHHLSLPERHGGAELPEIDLVDLREDKPEPLAGLPSGATQGWLSPSLRRALAETLVSGEQVLLYLNRRGYAPLTLCRACGHRLQCPNCTAWLVEHRLATRLQCHHCGYSTRLPESCPECSVEGRLAACGPGVERLSEEVAALYPQSRRAILSSDTVSGPQAMADLVQAVQAREVDVLIGTQIAAKGYHFPNLTLVGVVDADLGLFGGDLRATERTYQLLHQVSGRAGRDTRPGRVLIQTLDPQHPVMQALCSGDRDRFLEAESDQRRRAGMPPFGRLAALILSGPDPRQLDDLAALLRRRAPNQPGVEVLGPAPAPLAVLRGFHRRRFLIKTRRDVAPQPIVKTWLNGVKLTGRLRIQVDVDPYSFL